VTTPRRRGSDRCRESRALFEEVSAVTHRSTPRAQVHEMARARVAAAQNAMMGGRSVEGDGDCDDTSLTTRSVACVTEALLPSSDLGCATHEPRKEIACVLARI
jgi:hypothetical protein